jgi:hypothetical protein
VNHQQWDERRREEVKGAVGRGYSPGDSEFASTWLISELDMMAVLGGRRHADSAQKEES